MAFFKTKIPFWVNFGVSKNVRWWSTLWPFGSILQPFGIFGGYLVYFPPFWNVVPRKIWQPRTTIEADLFWQKISISRLTDFSEL
jgi:hypothetical protein